MVLDIAALEHSSSQALTLLGLPDLRAGRQACSQFISSLDGALGPASIAGGDLSRVTGDLRSHAPESLAKAYIAELVEVGKANRQLQLGVESEIRRVGLDNLIARACASRRGAQLIPGVAAARQDILQHAAATSMSLMDRALKILLADPASDPRHMQLLIDANSRVAREGRRAAQSEREAAERDAEQAEQTAGAPEVLEIIAWVVVLILLLLIHLGASGGTREFARQRPTLDPVVASLQSRLQEAERIAADCIREMKRKYEAGLLATRDPQDGRKCAARYLTALAKESRLARA
jgi:hypothetical protein